MGASRCLEITLTQPGPHGQSGSAKSQLVVRGKGNTQNLLSWS